ncbi:DUF2510 domain-containing protein [Parafrankia sp. EUN1f]|uniref:DUF2510 domain-containing protein n=1 Tax=Parafrankia sp. EUN1f TaxID=102897 RepID=UPI001E3954A4|nr:DUF2510 domain-containing protein [Parafrankia sp. EUN1f]
MTTPGGGPAAPGWYPDPQGRFAHRYFDGSGWTDEIDDGRGWHGPESGWPVQLRPGPGPGAGGGGGGGAGGGGDGPSTAGVTVVLLGALTMGGRGRDGDHRGRCVPPAAPGTAARSVRPPVAGAEVRG